MNHHLEPPTQPPPPPLRFSTCNRHPDQPITGFCASCLRERLAGLDPANPNRPKTSSSSTTATSALKAIFKVSTGESSSNNHRNKPSSSSSSSFFPELRRSKSFSGGRGEGFSGVLEPQRKSCDVRVRSTLWSLFNLDNERKGETTTTTSKEVLGQIEVETRNLLGFSGVGDTVLESKEEEEEDEEEEGEEEEEEEEEKEEEEEEEEEVLVVEEEEEVEENVEEIRVLSEDDVVVPVQSNVNLIEERVLEIEEEEELAGEEEEVKTMKDHIDLESQCKKPAGRDLKEIAGSFWLAASVFSKKLQKWRKKQKMKKRENGRGSAAMRVDKRAGRQFRETQSEVADYGFGRRSCDTDPRFSLDAGRMSFDDPRYSFDEPRASWDGYLIGRIFPRLPPMVSVVEDVPVPVRRSDNQIPVEEPMDSINQGDHTAPGGTAQTKDYYSDSSSSQRQRSLDGSSSVRKTVEVDEMKSVSNAKVSPATIDYINGPKVLVTDRDLKDSNSNSLRDDRSESFESAFRDGGSIFGVGDRKGSKKSRRWSRAWNIWGLIHRRGSNKDEEERYCRGNVVQRSFSESWPELRREINGEPKVSFNRNAFRSNSSVSSRSSSTTGGLFGSIRRSNAETNGNSKKKEEFVLERNRSARYSPTNVDNGLLRFYLTPLRSSRRSGSGKSRPKSSHSIARSVLRLY